MDNNNQNGSSFTEIHHTHLGPVLGILLVILVLILGGLYLWGASLNQEVPTPVVRTIPNNEPETPRAEADQQILETVSPSDELSAIEADLGATNVDSLTMEMDQAARELDQSFQVQ